LFLENNGLRFHAQTPVFMPEFCSRRPKPKEPTGRQTGYAGTPVTPSKIEAAPWRAAHAA
jgi:hypothetical protein